MYAYYFACAILVKVARNITKVPTIHETPSPMLRSGPPILTVRTCAKCLIYVLKEKINPPYFPQLCVMGKDGPIDHLH